MTKGRGQLWVEKLQVSPQQGQQLPSVGLPTPSSWHERVSGVGKTNSINKPQHQPMSATMAGAVPLWLLDRRCPQAVPEMELPT